jgi:retinol dehydrogenase-13
VNNAAVTPKRREETPEGIELQFATNVLGYFWMIQAFADILKRSAPARVVNVASDWAGDLELEDLEFKRRRYDNNAAYRQSKQADRMLTVPFAERLKPLGITVNACHPGEVPSTLSHNLGFHGHPPGGARTVWLATDRWREDHGKFFADCREVGATPETARFRRLSSPPPPLLIPARRGIAVFDDADSANSSGFGCSLGSIRPAISLLSTP